MAPVTRLNDVLEAVQRARQNAPNFCTNFFPVEPVLRLWIQQGDLSARSEAGCAFFLRRDRDFFHFYFAAPEAAALGRGLAALNDIHSEPVVVDLIGRPESWQPLAAVFAGCRFRPYRRLVRLARAAKPLPPLIPRDTPPPPVVWPDEAESGRVLELIEQFFDRYSDQLPTLDQVRAAVAAHQILAVKVGGELAALLFYETQGLTSLLRYWLVARPHESRGFGSALLREYLGSQTTVRRFLLWVAAQNERAMGKYLQYGYAADGLEDEIMVNERITA